MDENDQSKKLTPEKARLEASLAKASSRIRAFDTQKTNTPTAFRTSSDAHKDSIEGQKRAHSTQNKWAKNSFSNPDRTKKKEEKEKKDLQPEKPQENKPIEIAIDKPAESKPIEPIEDSLAKLKQRVDALTTSTSRLSMDFDDRLARVESLEQKHNTAFIPSPYTPYSERTPIRFQIEKYDDTSVTVRTGVRTRNAIAITCTESNVAVVSGNNYIYAELSRFAGGYAPALFPDTVTIKKNATWPADTVGSHLIDVIGLVVVTDGVITQIDNFIQHDINDDIAIPDAQNFATTLWSLDYLNGILQIYGFSGSGTPISITSPTSFSTTPTMAENGVLLLGREKDTITTILKYYSLKEFKPDTAGYADNAGGGWDGNVDWDDDWDTSGNYSHENLSFGSGNEDGGENNRDHDRRYSPFGENYPKVGFISIGYSATSPRPITTSDSANRISLNLGILEPTASTGSNANGWSTTKPFVISDATAGTAIDTGCLQLSGGFSAKKECYLEKTGFAIDLLSSTSAAEFYDSGDGVSAILCNVANAGNFVYSTTSEISLATPFFAVDATKGAINANATSGFSCDNVAGLTVIRTFEDVNNQVHTVTLKGGIVTDWTVA